MFLPVLLLLLRELPPLCLVAVFTCKQDTGHLLCASLLRSICDPHIVGSA